MTITWDAACPTTVKKEHKYLINITEVNHNESTFVEIPGMGKKSMKHEMDLHIGGEYEVVITTGKINSRPTAPIKSV